MDIIFSCKAVGSPWCEKYIEAEKQGVAHCRIFYFCVKRGVAHEQENILKLRCRGWPIVEYFIFLFSRGWPPAEKYIAAEEQGGADFRILYFAVMQGVAHELKNILQLISRVGPT